MDANQIIDERYRLERLLGTGGMSEVWLGEDQRLGRWVAVKLLRDGGGSADLTAALEREARIVARLQHPNIAAVYDAGRYQGRPYVVMEYIHGLSVREIMERRGRMDEVEAIPYAVQAADALAYAHGQGVLHCDIKPENLLVTERGVTKAVDFGVAETVTRTLTTEEAREVLGTLAYMAPEVIQGEPADARSDVYSLALTLYEMVAGRAPFSGRTAAASAGQRLASAAPPLRALAAGASPALEALLARALALSPADRFQSASAFGSALARLPLPPIIGAAAPAVVIRSPRPIPRPPQRAGRLPVRQDTARVRPRPAGPNVAAIAAISGAIALLGGSAIAAALIFGGGGRANDVRPVPTVPATAVVTLAATRTPAPSPTGTATPRATSTATTSTATQTRTPTPSPTSAATPVPTTVVVPRPSATPSALPTGTAAPSATPR